VFIKFLLPINKQFSIDSFLDWESHYWIFAHLNQITTTLSLRASIERNVVMRLLQLSKSLSTVVSDHDISPYNHALSKVQDGQCANKTTTAPLSITIIVQCAQFKLSSLFHLK